MMVMEMNWRQMGQSKGLTYLGLVTIGNQVPGTPSVGADPRKSTRGIVAPDRPHYARDLLIRPKYDGT